MEEKKKKGKKMKDGGAQLSAAIPSSSFHTVARLVTGSHLGQATSDFGGW